MITKYRFEERAWEPIEAMAYSPDVLFCPHCGGSLRSFGGLATLKRGTVRLGCLHCMQRFDYDTVLPQHDYEGAFGSF